MPSLLAVDLGLRTGLAAWDAETGLRWYRSQNFGTPARLRRAVSGILSDVPGLERVVVEGGGPLAEIWEREAERRRLRVRRIAAETWRTRLLLPREQRTGARAKGHADEVARRVIEWSSASRPTSLRHDAAEAVLIALWGALDAGWLERVPVELRR
jgi:hypothetical protein